MGFGFDDLIGAVGTILGGPVVGAAAQKGAQALGIGEADEPAKKAAVETAAGTSLAKVGATQAVASGVGAITGVRMKNEVRTIVETLNPANQVIRREILAGRPWLMRTDFVVMKRVLRTLDTGNEKVPRKTTKSPKKDKDLAKALGMIQGMIACGNARGLVNIQND